MSSNPIFRRHAALVDRMADRIGTDLEEAVLRGRLEFEELSEAVIRCASCLNPDRCEYILDHSIGSGAPAYCRNTELFNRMGRNK